MRALAAATVVCAVTAAVPAALRWLRVAQREHYLAGAATRFASRWWSCSASNLVAGLAGAAAAVASLATAPAALGAALVSTLGPLGLGGRGRTARLAWTRRLRTLAAVTAGLTAGAVGAGAGTGGLAGACAAAALSAIGMPLIVDAALGITAPLEARLAARHVAEASRRIAAVRPRVVGITGSYGKTSTKGYVAQLLAGRYTVVASPRSFNNRAGLARTVNEHLVPGTDVLVAEMGAFGPGEIAAVCSWMPPEVAVMTAIGPVHLERFGSIEAIVEAKTEITERAATCVLNVDDERLATLAGRLSAASKHVVCCSASRPGSADVAVVADAGTLLLYIGGQLAGRAPAPDPMPPALSNVACAAGAALALGCTPEELLARLPGLEGAANRLAVERTAGGVTVLDDTYNSNPAGARLALSTLAAVAAGPAGPAGGDGAAAPVVGRRVVVTPGMVELGRMQAGANAELARQARELATDLVVVGRTNRRALLAGATAPPGASAAGTGAAGAEALRVRCVAHREEAVAWVRAELGAGAAVLYENDLPDHFP